VILSGGLGSSAYVREALQEHLTKLNHSNARNIVVIPSQDPQLVVARGILENKRQRMESGNKSVLSSWIARASYGVVVQEAYMPAKHFDENVRQDPWDPNVKWATNQIQWLIRKVRAIESKGLLCINQITGGYCETRLPNKKALRDETQRRRYNTSLGRRNSSIK
jgi:hypothetical protein